MNLKRNSNNWLRALRHQYVKQPRHLLLPFFLLSFPFLFSRFAELTKEERMRMSTSPSLSSPTPSVLPPLNRVNERKLGGRREISSIGGAELTLGCSWQQSLMEIL